MFLFSALRAVAAAGAVVAADAAAAVAASFAALANLGLYRFSFVYSARTLPVCLFVVAVCPFPCWFLVYLPLPLRLLIRQTAPRGGHISAAHCSQI